MNYIVNEELIKSKGLLVEEVLLLMAIKVTKYPIDSIVQTLIDKKLVWINNEDGSPNLTLMGNDVMEKLLLAGDTAVPDETRIKELARKVMDVYPKGGKRYFSYDRDGRKVEHKIPWRGNIADICKRLKKFFKIYGQYTDDQIIQATQNYVSLHNNGDDSMRVLGYFILKDENKIGEDGKGYVEQKSDLASFIEAGEIENTSNHNFGDLI